VIGVRPKRLYVYYPLLILRLKGNVVITKSTSYKKSPDNFYHYITSGCRVKDRLVLITFYIFYEVES